MSNAGDHPALDPTNSTMVWDEIAGGLDRFVVQWEANPEVPPECESILNSMDETIRPIAVVELIKLDMDYRSRSNFPLLNIEDYVSRFPGLLDLESVEPDLIYEEYHVRKQAGESVSVAEYIARFPVQGPALKRLMHAETMTFSTSIRNKAIQNNYELGDTVGDFDLLARLGEGAFATVFLARQKSLQRLVALKISANQGAEPQTLAQMDHPNIVRVYDQSVLPDDSRLLYMKYVPGGTLQDVIEFSRDVRTNQRDGSTLVRAVDQQLDLRGESAPHMSAMRLHWLDAPWAQAVCDLGVQMADALEYAHEQGVLHRDLKPANILLTAEAAPQLVDFNISFCSKLDGASPSAFFGGSLAYMSPEQMEACNPEHDREPESLKPTSDIYSLAVVLWELYFGQRPFADKAMEGSWSSTLEVFGENRKGDPQPIPELMKRTDPQRDSLLEVLLKCLQFDTDDRIQTAAQLKHELQLASSQSAKRILRPAQTGMLGFAQRHPFIVSTLVLLIPNILAGMFNLYYNLDYIVNSLCGKTGQAEDFIKSRFFAIQTIINLIAFPIGTAAIFLGHRPIALAVLAMRRGESIGSQRLRNLRHRALRFGNYAVTIVVAIWALAGIVYPLSMHLSGIKLEMVDRLHFLISLILSGIIGNAYPYVAQSYFSLRALYPNLIDERDETHLDDIEPLKRMTRHCYAFLVLAIMLPMFAVMLIASMGGDGYSRALLLISLMSLIGTALAFRYTRIIRTSVETLTQFYRDNAAR